MRPECKADYSYTSIMVELYHHSPTRLQGWCLINYAQGQSVPILGKMGLKLENQLQFKCDFEQKHILKSHTCKWGIKPVETAQNLTSELPRFDPKVETEHTHIFWATICAVSLRNITKGVSQEGRCPGRDVNSRPSDNGNSDVWRLPLAGWTAHSTVP
jgi:hypothetical protein